ncbi:MAG TPA: signal peptidase I [Puia sp.]|nr:signal peptidase I [Puia sp.]
MNQVAVLVLIQLLILLLPSPGAYRLFEKAGVAGWKAFLPFYNTWIMQRLAGRPLHWVFWQLVPIVGWFISMGIYIEFVRTFGKFRFYEHALAALLPVAYFAWLGWDHRVTFKGAETARAYRKSRIREWVDAAVFAVVAATLIRTFVFEAYVIPTPSMEKTLLTNDYLFVSKIAYGPRLPMTPLSVPFVHNTLPLIGGKSYLEWVRIPYIRWFPVPVRRGDDVVFNFPIGDTVIDLPDFQSQRPYYDVCRELGRGNIDSGRALVLADPDQYPLVVRPVDKEENFIKRCVAIPGDTLLIRDEVVYIDGHAQPIPPASETWYTVTTNGSPLDEAAMEEEFGVDMTSSEEFRPAAFPNEYSMLLTRRARDKMLSSGLALEIKPQLDSAWKVFPYSTACYWTQDNFGPLYVPRKGSTVQLTPANYALYERAIRIYEKNSLEKKNGVVYLNGRPADRYTFKMDYYWMMGDNRHGSLDSRFWGFVPEDHIVGRADLIWMSWDRGVRWNRLFRLIR